MFAVIVMQSTCFCPDIKTLKTIQPVRSPAVGGKRSITVLANFSIDKHDFDGTKLWQAN